MQESDITWPKNPDRCRCGSTTLRETDKWLVCQNCGRVGRVVHGVSNMDHLSPHPLLDRYFPR